MSCSVHDVHDLESRGVPAVFVARSSLFGAVFTSRGSAGASTAGAAGVATGGVATATAERMSISYLSLTRSVGSGPVEGFPLFVSPDGGWHRHFVFEATRADGGLPQPAIYVLPMVLASDQPGVEPTEEFFLVFNDGLSEEEHDAAIEWVEANLASGHACEADLDRDGSVGGGDLAVLLGAWS